MVARKQTFEAVRTITGQAGEDLTGTPYRLLKLNATGTGYVKSAAAGDYSVGVLAMDPNPTQGSTADSTGLAIVVALLEGIVLVEAGNSITAGHLLESDSVGRVISAGANIGALAAGDYCIGTALEAAGAAGEIIAVRAQPFLHAA